MEYFTLFFEALIDLSNAMAPYILFGLVFAGTDDGKYGAICKHTHITNQLSSKWGKKVNVLVVYTYEPYRYVEVVKRVPYPPTEYLMYILTLLISIFR